MNFFVSPTTPFKAISIFMSETYDWLGSSFSAVKKSVGCDQDTPVRII